jgi:small subunit ribosomal protein S1
VIASAAKEEQPPAVAGQLDLSAFSSMLKERWKGGSVSVAKSDEVRAGQIRSFKITKLDQDAKTIDVQLI